MNNPWEEIPLDAYEKHMALESVQQLQAMNAMMAKQFAQYPVKSVMILGVAGGNGLEHIDPQAIETVYGVDINPDYLAACAARYPALAGKLCCLCADLLDEQIQLPCADLLAANLLIEYIGYPAFQRAVCRVRPQYVSCIIQINQSTAGGEWVSETPYLHVFDGLDAVHHQMEEAALTAAMAEAGYQGVLTAEHPLPNGKKLVRLDFQRT